MLSIRLQRTGKRNQPQFRIVLAEKQKHPTKKFIEVLGSYNPRTKDFQLRDPERVKYWLTQQVEVSPTVHNLLVSKEVLKGEPKVIAWKPKKKKNAESQTSAAAKAEDSKPQQGAESVKSEAAEVMQEKVSTSGEAVEVKP